MPGPEIVTAKSSISPPISKTRELRLREGSQLALPPCLPEPRFPHLFLQPASCSSGRLECGVVGWGSAPARGHKKHQESKHYPGFFPHHPSTPRRPGIGCSKALRWMDRWEVMWREHRKEAGGAPGTCQRAGDRSPAHIRFAHLPSFPVRKMNRQRQPVPEQSSGATLGTVWVLSAALLGPVKMTSTTGAGT